MAISYKPIFGEQPQFLVFSEGSTLDHSFSALPEEIIIHIFSFLSFHEVARNFSVSKKWNQLSLENSLWELFCKKCFPKTCEKGWVADAVEPRGYDIFKLLNGINLPKHTFTGLSLHGPKKISIEGDIFIQADLSGLHAWSLSKGKKLYTIQPYGEKIPFFVELHIATNRNRLVSSYHYNRGPEIEIRNLINGKLLMVYPSQKMISALDIENECVVSGNVAGEITLCKANRMYTALKKHDGVVKSIVIKGERILSAGVDGKIMIWNSTTLECLSILDDNQGPINSIAFDGNHIVSGGNDRKVRVWDIETKICRTFEEEHEDQIQKVSIENDFILSCDQHSIGISDEGRWVYSNCNKQLRQIHPDEKDVSKNIYLWDINTEECLKKYHTILQGAVAMQGEVILAGNKDIYLKSGISLYTLNSYKVVKSKTCILM